MRREGGFLLLLLLFLLLRFVILLFLLLLIFLHVLLLLIILLLAHLSPPTHLIVILPILFHSPFTPSLFLLLNHHSTQSFCFLLPILSPLAPLSTSLALSLPAPPLPPPPPLQALLHRPFAIFPLLPLLLLLSSSSCCSSSAVPAPGSRAGRSRSLSCRRSCEEDFHCLRGLLVVVD